MSSVNLFLGLKWYRNKHFQAPKILSEDVSYTSRGEKIVITTFDDGYRRKQRYGLHTFPATSDAGCEEMKAKNGEKDKKVEG